MMVTDTELAERPSLRSHWDRNRPSLETRIQMKKGLHWNIAWFKPMEPPSFRSEPVSIEAEVYPHAQYRFVRGPHDGWSLLAKWSDRTEWVRP